MPVVPSGEGFNQIALEMFKKYTLINNILCQSDICARILSSQLSNPFPVQDVSAATGAPSPPPSLAHKMLAASPLSFSPPPPPPSTIAGALHVCATARQLPKSIARVHISGRTHLDLAKKKASADQESGAVKAHLNISWRKCHKGKGSAFAV